MCCITRLFGCKIELINLLRLFRALNMFYILFQQTQLNMKMKTIKSVDTSAAKLLRNRPKSVEIDQGAVEEILSEMHEEMKQIKELTQNQMGKGIMHRDEQQADSNASEKMKAEMRKFFDHVGAVLLDLAYNSKDTREIVVGKLDQLEVRETGFLFLILSSHIL